VGKNLRYIWVLLIGLAALPLWAKKPAQPARTLSVEQTQQFTYYWYAAKQAIVEERYGDAYALLEFCRLLKEDDGQVLYCLGIIYQGLGQADNAAEAFEKAYAVQPKGTAGEDLLEQIKRIYITREEWSKALQIQDEIDAVSGYGAMSALSRYRIYALWGKPKKAMDALDKYMETDPTNLRFMLFRVELLEHMGVKPKVLYAQYEQILALDPTNIVILNNYAYHLATHGGDLKRAERMSEITIREQPDSPVYLDTYGWIMHLQGQDELALFYLNRALWNAEDETKAEIEKHIRIVKGEK